MKKIRITTNHGHLHEEILGHVFGTWAAHPGWGTDDWTVSDLKSGLAAFVRLDEGEAILCAARLGANIEAPEIVGDLSDIMARRHSYVDMDPFEFKYLCESIVAEVFE